MILRDEHETLLSGKQKSIVSRFFPDWSILAIMLAQLSLFVFAWTLAGLMMHKTIPLPDSRATWVQNNPSDIQFVVTLVSTIFGLAGSALLSRAVQYALVRRLSDAPLRLHTIIEWVKLAQRSISLNFETRRLSWTLLSVAWVSLLGFLTTAWSTLLAPESVVIYHSFQGNETNLLHPAVSNLFDGFGIEPPPGFNLTPARTNAFININPSVDLVATLMDAGYGKAAAQRFANDPFSSTLAINFIDIPGSEYVGNISTGGIYPPGLFSPTYYSYSGIGDPLYQGFSRTYNVTEQGFTANVSCRAPTSNDPVITSNLTNSVLISANEYDEWAMDTYSWSTNCSSEVEYSTFGVTIINDVFDGSGDQLSGENGLLMTSVCFGQGFYGRSNQSFLVLLAAPSNSSYIYLNQICQVTPTVTTVQTTYDSTGIVNIIQPPLYQHHLPHPTSVNNTGVLMWFPALAIWTTFVSSQGLTANMMGDKLLMLPYPDPSSIENYLRGMMEYLGSLMAAKVALDASAGPDMVVQFNGTANVHTYGWTFHLRTHGTSLAAITLVTLLTVAAGVFAMVPAESSSNAQASRSQKLQAPLALARAFDPTGTMDVLLASSAGDLSRVLSESGGAYRPRPYLGGSGGEKRGECDGRGVAVMLGTTGEGWPALRTVAGVDGAGADVGLGTLRDDEGSSAGVA